MNTALLDYIETLELSDYVKKEARNFVEHEKLEEACDLIVNSLEIERQILFLRFISQLDEKLHVLCVLRVLLDYQPNWLLKLFLARQIIETRDTRFASTLMDVLERILNRPSLNGDYTQYRDFHTYILENAHYLVGEEAMIPHLKKHLFATYGDTRQVLQDEAFDLLTTRGGEAILEYFIWLLKTDYTGGGEMPRGRDKLFESLIKFGDQAVPPLLDVLYNHSKIERRADAARLLKDLGAPQAFDVFEPLVEALRQNLIHNEHAAPTFIALGQVDRLIELLNDESGHVRATAVIALGRLRDKKAVEPLIDLFWRSPKSDDRFFVRFHIIRAFDWLNDPRALDIVLEYRSRDHVDGFIKPHDGQDTVARPITKLPDDE